MEKHGIRWNLQCQSKIVTYCLLTKFVVNAGGIFQNKHSLLHFVHDFSNLNASMRSLKRVFLFLFRPISLYVYRFLDVMSNSPEYGIIAMASK